MATRYRATLDGNQHELEIAELSAGSYQIKFAGVEYNLDVYRINATSFSILVCDRSFDLDVIREGEDLIVASRSGAARVTLLDARSARRAAISGRPQITGRAEIKAMMPGRIVNVLVNAGDEVTRHQGVVVVEAMKMENELKSPKSGKIVEIRIAPGQTVEKGDLLVVIE